MNEPKRMLLPRLNELIMELVDINKDIATLEVRDAITSVRRAKKAVLAHQRNTEAFKKELDEIRKEILKDKLDTPEEDLETII